MIENKEQALELCAKFGIKLAEHKTVIVTGNNSIYLSDNIDPADTSEKFFLKGGTISIETTEDPIKVGTVTEVLTEIEDLEKENDKAKDKKSKK